MCGYSQRRGTDLLQLLCLLPPLALLSFPMALTFFYFPSPYVLSKPVSITMQKVSLYESKIVFLMSFSVFFLVFTF